VISREQAAYNAEIDRRVRNSREDYDIAYEELVNHLKVCELDLNCEKCWDLYTKCDKAAENLKKALYLG
jgi:hypothetical protein